MLNSSWQVFRFVFVLSLLIALGAQSAIAQTAKQTPTTGKRYPRLVIRNVMIADGNGTPASGPKDIVIEGNLISEIVPLDPVALKAGRARRPAGDIEIDGTGRYVLPGDGSSPGPSGANRKSPSRMPSTANGVAGICFSSAAIFCSNSDRRC